jgi:hypothetical protein
MLKFVIFAVIAYFVYTNFFGIESGCEEYASRYSCDYVKSKASYDVYYWQNVRRGDPSDEKYIASVTGLSACRSSAVSYARSINEEWNNRSYICVLKKDGRSMEKHR